MGLGVPDGAVVADRAVLEETAGRAAARMVRGRRTPAGARNDVIAATPERRVIAIATLVSSVDTTRCGFPIESDRIYSPLVGVSRLQMHCRR